MRQLFPPGSKDRWLGFVDCQSTLCFFFLFSPSFPPSPSLFRTGIYGIPAEHSKSRNVGSIWSLLRLLKEPARSHQVSVGGRGFFYLILPPDWKAGGNCHLTLNSRQTSACKAAHARTQTVTKQNDAYFRFSFDHCLHAASLIYQCIFNASGTFQMG